MTKLLNKCIYNNHLKCYTNLFSLFDRRKMSISINLSIYLSIYLFQCVNVCMYVCVCVCVSDFTLTHNLQKKLPIGNQCFMYVYMNGKAFKHLFIHCPFSI